MVWEARIEEVAPTGQRHKLKQEATELRDKFQNQLNKLVEAESALERLYELICSLAAGSDSGVVNKH
eukprot:4733167-Karenia_brevis.AAC.1